MNRYKKLGILVLVLAVACAVTFGVSRYQEKQETIRTADTVILELDTEQITEISWEVDGTTLAFQKGDGWTYTGDSAFPVDAEKLGERLELFESFGVSFIIEDVEDYSQYGLDNPEGIIYLTTTQAIEGMDKDDEITASATEETTESTEETAEATGETAETTEETTEATTEATEATEETTEETAETTEETTETTAETTEATEETTASGEEIYTYTIRLGSYSTMDEKRYVSTGDGNVYLVNTDPMDLYDCTLSDLILDDEMPQYDQVTSLTVEGVDSYTATYQEESTSYRENDHYFVDGEPLDTSRVNSYAYSLKTLSTEEYVTYNATDEELEKYGLDEPELTVTLDYTAENEDGEDEAHTFVLHVSRDPEEDEEDDVENAYIQVGDSKILYRISADTYSDLIAATQDDLRHQEIIPADITSVAQVDVTLDGETYTFTAETDSDDEQTWYYNGEEIESDDLADDLAKLEASEFTDETPDAKEELSLTIYLTGEDEAQETTAATEDTAETTGETAETSETTGEATETQAETPKGTRIDIVLYRYDGESCLATVDGEPLCLTARSDVVALIEAINALVL